MKMRGENMARKTPITLIIGAAAAAAALLFDQISKAVVFAKLLPGDELILSPFLSILPGWNEGTAFGLASGTTPWLLVAVALAISAWLVKLLIKSSSMPEALGLGAAIGGALANVIDRLRFKAVRDFVDIHWEAYHWPTFNAADVFVVSGLLLFVLADRRRQKEDPGPL